MVALGAWLHLSAAGGILILFVLSLLEGPVVTLFAGFLAFQGLVGLVTVCAVTVAGDLCGDILLYAAGRWCFGRPRGGRLQGGRLPWPALHRQVEALRFHFAGRPGRVLLFGKLSHSAGLAVLLAAGAARMRFASFVLYNLLGTIPKSALLAGIGYGFGRFYQLLAGDLRVAGLLGVVVVCLVMIPLILRMDVPHHPDGLE